MSLAWFRTIGDFVQRVQAILWALLLLWSLGLGTIAVGLIHAIASDIPMASLILIGIGIVLVSLPVSYYAALQLPHSGGRGTEQRPNDSSFERVKEDLQQLRTEVEVLKSKPRPQLRPKFSERFKPALTFLPEKRLIQGGDAPLISTLLRVTNLHLRPEPVTNCTVRLIEAWTRRIAMNDDGEPDYRDTKMDIAPTYLTWVAEDGGGKSCSFANDASIELAHVELQPGLIHVQTVIESLKPKYVFRLDDSPTFVVQVCDDLGRKTEHGFSIAPNEYWTLRSFVEKGDEVSPLHAVKFKRSDSWLGRATLRVLKLENEGKAGE